MSEVIQKSVKHLAHQHIVFFLFFFNLNTSCSCRTMSTTIPSPHDKTSAVNPSRLDARVGTAGARAPRIVLTSPPEPGRRSPLAVVSGVTVLPLAAATVTGGGPAVSQQGRRGLSPVGRGGDRSLASGGGRGLLSPSSLDHSTMYHHLVPHARAALRRRFLN
jgi:hypothetical protein